MTLPVVYDLGCGIGGASGGYDRVLRRMYGEGGYRIVGVDIEPQPHYQHEFVLADMLDIPVAELAKAALNHLSAPCQRWSKMTRCRPGLAATYPDLITPMRPRLVASGVPYVIENVEGAPLRDPVWLCGTMFGRDELYRHRGFETGNGLAVPQPGHPEHVLRGSRAGHWVPGTAMSLAGHVAPISKARELMDIGWYVPRESLMEAIPPYMTEYVASYAFGEVA
jgi:DNA (cytosine-5)-methyltransferase 1